MREISCKACGREIKSVMKFCPYCGSTDLVNSTFSNINNSYLTNGPGMSQNNQYSTNYQNNTPRKNNYTNNMYQNNNVSNNRGNNAYNGYSSTMYMSNSQNAQSNNYSTGYGKSSYSSNFSSGYGTTESNNNPYIANKDYYTKRSQQLNTMSPSMYGDNNEYEEEKKKISPWQMGIAAFAAILVVGLGVLYFTGTFDSMLNKSKTETTKTASDKSSSDTVVTGSADVKYEVGELKDDTYTNKWSNVVIKIPEGYSNKSEDGYNMYNTDYMDCGLYLENEAGESIVNLYVDLTNDDGSFSESAFIDESKTNYQTSGMEIVSSTDYSKMNICGNEYTYSHIVMKSGTSTITQSIYVRQQDKNACIFIITNVGENVEKSDTILNSFSNYSG